MKEIVNYIASKNNLMKGLIQSLKKKKKKYDKKKRTILSGK